MIPLFGEAFLRSEHLIPYFHGYVIKSKNQCQENEISESIPKSMTKLLMVLKTFVGSANFSPPKTQPTHHNAVSRD